MLEVTRELMALGDWEDEFEFVLVENDRGARQCSHMCANASWLMVPVAESEASESSGFLSTSSSATRSVWTAAREATS